MHESATALANPADHCCSWNYAIHHPAFWVIVTIVGAPIVFLSLVAIAAADRKGPLRQRHAGPIRRACRRIRIANNRLANAVVVAAVILPVRLSGATPGGVIVSTVGLLVTIGTGLFCLILLIANYRLSWDVCVMIVSLCAEWLGWLIYRAVATTFSAPLLMASLVILILAVILARGDANNDIRFIQGVASSGVILMILFAVVAVPVGTASALGWLREPGPATTVQVGEYQPLPPGTISCGGVNPAPGFSMEPYRDCQVAAPQDSHAGEVKAFIIAIVGVAACVAGGNAISAD